MKTETDRNKALNALREAGDNGIHSFHLNHIIGTTRSAARINDLKKMGHVIDSKYERMGDSWGVRYFLRSEKKAKTVHSAHTQVRYEFNKERNVFIAYSV